MREKRYKSFFSKLIFAVITFFLLLIFALVVLSMRPFTPVAEEISWGVGFSTLFSKELGLDWRMVYTAMLDELGVKKIRIPVYWTDVEPENNNFDFSSYDWMVEEARKRDAKLILVVGYKQPRWPECHIPGWAKAMDDNSWRDELLGVVEQTVKRYKGSSNVVMWQVENEPFLPFGIQCPSFDPDFLEKEISRVRILDSSRPVMVTDSGELSTWVRAARRADVFGTTLYRIVWAKKFNIGYIHYPLMPNFFWLKRNIVYILYPELPVMVSELQGEPWGPLHTAEISLEEQFKSMNMQQFQQILAYTQRAGFSEAYLWGVEWWYWLDRVHGHREFWEAARVIFASQSAR